MGQEIVHCSVCGLRLRSSDFDQNKAVRLDHTAYCRACIPEGMAATPATDKVSKKLNNTARIPLGTPRRGVEAVPGPSPNPALVWGGVGVVALVLLVGIVMATSSGKPAPPVQAPPPVAAPPVRPRTEAPRTEPAPAPAAAVPKAATPPVAPAAEAAELAALDARLAELSSKGRYAEALDALALAKPRHDSLEWTAEIQRRSHDLEKKVNPTPAPAPAPAATPAPTPEPVAEPAPAPAPGPAPAASAPASDRPTQIPFSAGAMKWTMLAPKKMVASSGSPMTLLEDGSILVGGDAPTPERYTIVVQTDLRTVNALRLEVLPDRSLPATGPGRAGNGNFVLSEIRVQALADPQAESGVPVLVAQSSSDFSQDGFTPAGAYDGKNDTGWAISPAFGRAHEAIFEFKTGLSGATPQTLQVVLDHQAIFDKHSIGRFRLSACTGKNAVQEIALRPPPSLDASRVDQAIQRGIAWLRTAPYPADYWMGCNELILWTYVHAGVPETDGDFQKRLKQMLDGPLQNTYRVALQAMILEELDRVGYQPRIWQCAQFLVDNQCLNGQWHYGTPTEIPKAPAAGRPVATGAKLDGDGRRVKPKVVKKLVARKTRDGPAEGDNSNSQYAALGLRACFDAGVAIPDETIHRAMKWWIESQYFDEKKEGEYAAKGWSYTSPNKDPRAYHAMTAGGISSLTIYDYMLGRDWKRNMPIKSGINWLAQFWTVNAGYYYLYGMERAGVLYGTDKFGRNVWYPLGAQWILDHQDASGAWLVEKPDPNKQDDTTANNVFNTCFAILYLKRATRPLVASEDTKK